MPNPRKVACKLADIDPVWSCGTCSSEDLFPVGKTYDPDWPKRKEIYACRDCGTLKIPSMVRVDKETPND